MPKASKKSGRNEKAAPKIGHKMMSISDDDLQEDVVEQEPAPSVQAPVAVLEKEPEEEVEKEPEKEPEEEPEWTVRHFGGGHSHYDAKFNGKILKYMENLGLLSDVQSRQIMDHYKKTGDNVIDSIVKLDILKSFEAGRVVADFFGVSYVNIKNTRVSSDITLLIPEEVSKAEGVIAYKEDEKGIYVAMVDPIDRHFLHLLEKKTGKKVIAQYSTPSEISAAQRIYAQSNLKGFQQLIDRATEDIDKLESLNNISTIFDTIVLMAYYRNASDIHIEPFEDEIRIRLRVDGVLNNVATLPNHFLETMVNHVKVLSKLRTDEHSSAQDGRFRVTYDNSVINFRVSILPSYYGEKMVLRLLSSESQELSLAELGYSPQDVAVIEKSIRRTQGITLITGPTGSGKTTTLYSVLTMLNRDNVNISTVEDPIEYGLYGLNQVQVNPKTNLNFADGLRSLLRQDPDIIMIGEIRDLDTAKISAHASLTGHLIFSTLHTSSAALAPLRLIQMGLDPYSIVSTLNLIVAQRLVRTICNSCRVTYQLTEEELKEIEATFINTKEQLEFFRQRFGLSSGRGPRLFKGKGCKECGDSGFQGRTVVAEVMEINKAIRDLIVAEASQEEIQTAALANGMTPILEDGLSKVLEGKTTLEEFFRVINQ